jgi:hypothetical protein
MYHGRIIFADKMVEMKQREISLEALFAKLTSDKAQAEVVR